MQYPINEMFQTLQGEGYFTGVPAIFIRLQGCPVGCAWCDTKHTWDKLADQSERRCDAPVYRHLHRPQLAPVYADAQVSEYCLIKKPGSVLTGLFFAYSPR